jgi:hypothetical protein
MKRSWAMERNTSSEILRQRWMVFNCKVKIRVTVTMPELFLDQTTEATEILRVYLPGIAQGGTVVLMPPSDPFMQTRLARLDMDRQGTVTDAGISAYENDHEITGALAVHVHMINETTVRLDLRMVDDNGIVLAEWEGVDLIDDSQITWMFSDIGKFKLTMVPTIRS